MLQRTDSAQAKHPSGNPLGIWLIGAVRNPAPQLLNPLGAAAFVIPDCGARFRCAGTDVRYAGLFIVLNVTFICYLPSVRRSNFISINIDIFGEKITLVCKFLKYCFKASCAKEEKII